MTFKEFHLSWHNSNDYDLIGIVETHLDSTIDENKLALNG